MDIKNLSSDDFNLTNVISTGTGYRIMDPSETWDKLKYIFSDMGINIYTQKIFGVDLVYTTLNYFSNGKCWKMKQEGKGLSSDQANVSGVMELIERYCNRVPDLSKIFYADYEKISDKVLNIKPLVCYICKKRYDTCEEDYLKKCREWVKVKSMITGKEMFVPRDIVYFSTLLSKTSDCFYGILSTGIAAGNNIDEAIFHGLFEVIERAQLYPFHYSSGTVSALGSIESWKISMAAGIRISALYGGRIEWPEVKNYPLIDLSDFIMSESYDKNFLENISVYQISNDFYGAKVYTMLAEVKSGELYYRGSVTHTDPSIAINRAITEMIQVGRKNLETNKIKKENNTQISNTKISASKLVNYSKCDINLDMRECLNKLSKAGLDVVVADLTKKNIGIPVVRVLIPDIKYI